MKVKEKMPFTGERLVPGYPEQLHLYQEHLVRYLFSSQFVKSKKVIDVGCGTGYGAYILSKNQPDLIIGSDSSAEAIQFGKKNFSELNLDFVKEDCTNSQQKTSFFDIAIAFELIEHLQEPDLFLKETKRILKKNGIFILSTPNKSTYQTENKFHKHEYEEIEFLSLLKKYFKNITILYQTYPSTLAIMNFGKDDIQEFTISGAGKKHNYSALYFVAICSDIDIENIDNKLFLFGEKTLLLENFPKLQNWIKILQSDIETKDVHFKSLQKDFEERTNWALELDSEIKNRDVKLKNLQKEFEQRSEWAIQLDKDSKEKSKSISNLQKEITSNESRLKKAQTQTTENKSRLKKAQTQTTENKSRLKKAQTQITENESRLKEAQTQITENESRLKEAQTQITENKSRLKEAQTQITENKSRLKKAQTQITENESRLKEAREQVSLRESQLKGAQDNYYLIKNELEAMKNSILLKIPLAFARNLDKAFPKSTKRGELIRLLRMSLLTLQNEGIGSLSKALQEKIKRQRLFKKKPFLKEQKYDFSKSLQVGKINNSNIIQGDKNKKLDQNLRNFLNTEWYDISNMTVFPKVSIIISTFNQIEFLKKNLQSIENKTTYKNYEIIIVTNNLDENSEIRQFLKTLKHKVCIFKKDYSFGEMNNFASEYANGDFLLFLNDDVEIVSASWLEYMLKLALSEKVGAVGPKLLFSNGKLQEAGGIIWKDGIIWNHGRNEDPEDSKFNFVRSVDYCSGCCLMIKKEIFERLGQFDPQYRPAYCEDADLCLAIQKEGLKILYQPLAVLIHYEGKTSGTDLKSGIKSYQVENQKKFRKKWKSFLNSRQNDSQNNVFLERNRKNGINILYIDHYIPEYNKDAGSLLVYYLLSSLSYMDHKVTFWPDNLIKTEPYATNLQQKGIEVIYNHTDFQSFIKKHRNDFQICITTRAHIAPKYIDLLKKHAPECKIIYDTVDLHFLREFREASLKQDSSKLLLAQKTKDLELEIFQKSDIVITKSLEEADFLLKQDSSHNFSIIPTFDLPPKEFLTYDERKDLLFLGGFQHPPNVDSLKYLINDLFPKIRKKLPDVKLYVIGSNPTQEITEMCSEVEGIIFLGYVKVIDSYLKKCRLLLAPLRFGAGVKGKITQSLAYGLVVITTPIGSEGISNKNDKLLISNSDNEFVENTISVYNNKELWTTLSLNSIKYSENNFSPEYIYDTLEQTINRCLQT